MDVEDVEQRMAALLPEQQLVIDHGDGAALQPADVVGALLHGRAVMADGGAVPDPDAIVDPEGGGRRLG